MLIKLPAGLLCLLYVVVFFVGNGQPNDGFSLLVLCVVAFKCAFRGRAEPLEFALTVALFYLFVMPCATLAYFGSYEYVIVTAISSPVFDLLVVACRRAPLPPRAPLGGSRVTALEYICWWALVGSLLFASAVLPPGDISRQLSFNVPFALSLVIFEKSCRTSGIRVVFLLIAAYLAAIAVYVNVHWNGFGRIVIGSYILMPLFIAHHWRDIGLRVWQAIIAAPVAIYIANVSRYHGQASFADMHSGSIGAHLHLTRELMDQMDFAAPAGWAGYWGQWLLLFVQWFPRALWSDKPVGVGRGYVDAGNVDSTVSEDHSVALGYVGEAVYYLGEQWVLGLAITLGTLIAARRLIARAGQGCVAPVLAYDVFLITFVWGGTASFGGRMAFFVLPMVAFIFLRRFSIAADGGVGGRQPRPGCPSASPKSAR